MKGRICGPARGRGVWGVPSKQGGSSAADGTEIGLPQGSPISVPGAVEFSNRLMAGLDRLWEMHDILPNPLIPGNENDLE